MACFTTEHDHMCGSGCQSLNHTHSRILQSDISSQAGWDLWQVWPNTQRAPWRPEGVSYGQGLLLQAPVSSWMCWWHGFYFLPFRCRGFNISKVSVCNFWSSPCNVDVNDSQLPTLPRRQAILDAWRPTHYMEQKHGHCQHKHLFQIPFLGILEF